MHFKNIILFFILLFLGYFSNSYIIEDVTPLDSYNKSYIYKGFGVCQFQYFIFCSPTNINESCASLTTDRPDLVEYGVFNTDGTTSIFVFGIMVNPGLYNITINSIFTISVECLYLNYSKVSLDLVGNGYFNYPDSNSYNVVPVALFRINGEIDKTLFLGTIRGINILNYPFTDIFYYVPSSTLSIYQNLSNIDAELNPSVKTIISPIDFKDYIYDVKTYPDLQFLNDTILMGYGSCPILEFKSKSIFFKNSFSITRNNETFNTQYYPIFFNSTDNSTTFLYGLSNYNIDTLYEIYYINDGQYQKVNTSIQVNVKQDSYIPLSKLNTFNSSYPNDTLIFNYGFIDNRNDILQPLQIIFDDKIYISRFPYGYTNLYANGTFSFTVNSLFRPFLKNSDSYYPYIQTMIGFQSLFFVAPFKDRDFIYNVSKSPKIKDLESIHLYGDVFLIRLNISTPYSLDYILCYDSKKYYGKEALISGNLFEGIYEVVLKTTSTAYMVVYDIYGNSDNVSSGKVFSLNPLKIFTPPTYTQNFNFTSVENISFLYNEVDVTNKKHYNILYIKCSKCSKDPSKLFSMAFLNGETFQDPNKAVNALDTVFYSTWNETIQLFQIEFYINANSHFGELNYFLLGSFQTFFNQYFNTPLKIKCKYVDLQGPMFKSIQKSSNNTLDQNNTTIETGWSIVIEDQVNGFDYGYVTIKGELDQSIYNFTFNSSHIKSGDEYLGEYDFKFDIFYPCISQTYSIYEVTLYDKVRRISYFSKFPQSEQYFGVVNPFLYFLNDSSINKIDVSCEYPLPQNLLSIDTSPPILQSFYVSTNSIDVGKKKRKIEFQFKALDKETGLKNYQYPIVFLSTSNNRVIECQSNITAIDHPEGSYSCQIELPLGFGFPDGILISVYGFINNYGSISGYSSIDLMNLGYQYSITTIFEANDTVITGGSGISEKGGDIWIFGRMLDLSSEAHIKYYDGNTDIIKLSKTYSTTVLIQNIKGSYYPFEIYIKTPNMESNTLLIHPTIYNYYINKPFPTNPTLQPIPTNSPQSCPGNPVCGGPSNGYCVQNQGCVCISPWIGIDCLSQIVIIDQPTISNTNPTTEINLPTNGTNTTISYRSLISLVSLREININGEQVINTPFNKWIARSLDNTTFLYFTSLEIDNGNGNKTVTYVTATLKWFINQSTIIFANEQLLMHASTMKYTIEISNYPFSNRLNQLQLIMSAFIQSDKSNKDICSLKEFGETSSGDNSNYLKIQVDNHSLYGRFIKRGIIDSVITSVSNILLDSDFKSINNPSTIQSYIGIQIPYYTKSIILDPDFSILVDSYSASSKSGSNCNNNSKLSTGKIIGIVLGCVAFVSIIIIIISYHIIKRKNEKIFLKNINQKMSQIKNDKL